MNLSYHNQIMGSYNREFHKQFEQLAYTSAQEVVAILRQFLRPASVIDVGCGTATWLSVWREHGVEDVFGVDGDYVNPEWLKIPKDRFMAFDLNCPLKLERTFELASTLEVAEHIPPEHADQFVDSMVRLSPVVLFSAAIPHQGGVFHVNEQWQAYWAERFARRDYLAVDCVRPRVWTNKAVSVAYRQNILLYVRRDALARNAALRREHEMTRDGQLSSAHPESYLEKVRALEGDISFKRALKALPRAFVLAVRRRLEV